MTIDDLITVNATEQSCFDNIRETTIALDVLGFVIHPEKSTFIPTQKLDYLGFIIDSVAMTVSLTDAKKAAILKLCDIALTKQKVTIRFIAKLLGKIFKQLYSSTFWETALSSFGAS